MLLLLFNRKKRKERRGRSYNSRWINYFTYFIEEFVHILCGFCWSFKKRQATFSGIFLTLLQPSTQSTLHEIWVTNSLALCSEEGQLVNVPWYRVNRTSKKNAIIHWKYLIANFSVTLQISFVSHQKHCQTWISWHELSYKYHVMKLWWTFTES